MERGKKKTQEQPPPQYSSRLWGHPRYTITYHALRVGPVSYTHLTLPTKA